MQGFAGGEAAKGKKEAEGECKEGMLSEDHGNSTKCGIGILGM